MKTPIRVGILSTAHYHGHFWAEAIARQPDAALAGIWDDDPARGREAAARHGTRYVADLDTLLRECDGVGITAETAKHAPLIEAAAGAGVHVLCEKPMATTLDECDRIERAVRASGIAFMQNFPKRFDPLTRELVERVQDGAVGRVVMVRVRHGHSYALDPAFRAQWYCDPTLAGGGALLDEGVHVSDVLLWMLGAPATVSAAVSSRAVGLAVDDTALATYVYANGTIAEIATGWTMIAAESWMEILGTEGTVLLSGGDLASREFAVAPYLKTFRSGATRGTWEGSPTAPVADRGVTHGQGPRHFIECLRDGRTPRPGIAEGRRSLAMILAAYRAAASGRREPLDLDAPETR